VITSDGAVIAEGSPGATPRSLAKHNRATGDGRAGRPTSPSSIVGGGFWRVCLNLKPPGGRDRAERWREHRVASLSLMTSASRGGEARSSRGGQGVMA
jgi:hypothetical protein